MTTKQWVVHRWTAAEVTHALRLAYMGHGGDEIAVALGRTQNSVRKMLRRSGVLLGQTRAGIRREARKRLLRDCQRTVTTVAPAVTMRNHGA